MLEVCQKCSLTEAEIANNLVTWEKNGCYPPFDKVCLSHVRGTASSLPKKEYSKPSLSPPVPLSTRFS